MLCPRCSGLHFAGFTTFFLLIFFSSGRIKFKGFFPAGLMGLILFLMGLDWMLGQTDIYDPTVFSRVATGLSAGVVSGILGFIYLRNLNPGSHSQVRQVDGWQILLLVLLVSIPGYFLILKTGWMILTMVLLIAVLSNFMIIGFIVFRRVRYGTRQR